MNKWRTVKDFPRYEVNRHGDVRLTDNKKSVDYCIRKDNNLEYINLNNGKQKQFVRNKLIHNHFPFEWIVELDNDEEATEIKDAPGYYVTTKARVWSTQSCKWLAENTFNDYKYGQVHLYRNGDCVTKNIHTLVGRAFLKDYQEGLLILHNDETLPFPEVNYLSNLRVGTEQDNKDDMKDKGRKAVQVPLKVKEAFHEFAEKYFDLVWYARSNPELYRQQGRPEEIINGALNAQAKIQEKYPDELDEFYEAPDWTHGFNSGCLATMRFVLDAIYPEVIPAEETDDGEEWVMGGLEFAQEEFPMLDT